MDSTVYTHSKSGPRSTRQTLQLILRALFLIVGMGTAAWALLSPAFRDEGGYLSGRAAMALAVALALFVLSWGVAGPARFAAWLSLAVVGQAASLQLIDAGPGIHYQHYLTLPRLLASPLLLAVGIQAVLVTAGLLAYRNRIVVWIRAHLRPWMALALAAVLSLFSAVPSLSISAYAAELIFAALVQLINLGNLVLLVLSLPQSINLWAERFLTPPNSSPIAQGAEAKILRLPGKTQDFILRYGFVLAAAIWAIAVPALLNLFIYENHPHLQDEVIYLWQARILAQGQLTIPAPPVPAAFAIFMVPLGTNEWYGIFSPGWPAILAAGVRLGVPWLVNPLLSGLNVLLAYRLLSKLYSPRMSRLAIFLLCISPWYLFLAMSFMSHTLTLTCALAAALALEQARGTGKATVALLSGAAVGALSLVRPQDGVVLAALLGLWALGLGGNRLKFSQLAAYGLGILLAGGLIFPYNAAVTGSPLRFPLEAYFKEQFGPLANAFGFGPGRGMGWPLDAFPGHSPIEAGVNSLLNMISLNTELFGWSSGSLLLILALFALARLNKVDRLMLAVPLSVSAFYGLYWFSSGPDFGPRYWYLALVPLVALSARGLEALGEKIQTGNLLIGATPRLLAVPLILGLLSTGVFLPWRALDKYSGYLGMRPVVPALAQANDFGRSLVLIQGGEHPDYTSAWVYNPLDYQANVPIYAFDHEPGLRARLEQAYPDRPLWVVAGPSITGGAYQVIEAPAAK